MVPFTNRWMVLLWAPPLGPLFADSFLSFHERIWLNNCPLDFKSTYYRRYVDDWFLLFRSPSHIPLFLDFLSHQHPNIKFTSEIEPNNTLPFLDVKITLSNRSFSTSVYHKPTFAGLFTNFGSFIPLSYKRSLILSLLHRFFNLCSNYENFHKELNTFKNIYKLNGYPAHFFDKCVYIFLDKVFVLRPLLHHVPQKVLYFSLPFTGTHSLLKSAHKFLVFVCPPFPTSTFVSSFVQPSVFSTFSPLRTEFPKV